MSEFVPFQLKLTGDTADHHQFQGYDGYMALAGFAWTLSLVANYVQTGEIRHRGDFPGRHAVRARATTEGSIVADFAVWLQHNPVAVLSGTAAAAQITSGFLIDTVKRVISRNLGEDADPEDPVLKRLMATRPGDIEALVAVSEPSIRQTHGVIGAGAENVAIIGGFNLIGTYDEDTRDYVKANIEDKHEIIKDFSIGAFDVNSGHGSVFDADIGRLIPISMPRAVLREVSNIFTWGLDQYANKTGKKVTIRYTRILAMDGRPKRYVVLNARRAP